MKRPQLSIVILSYNTRDLLRNCLESLERLTSEIPFEVIVVDNASRDGSVDFIKGFKKKSILNLKLITSKENLGFGRGNNMAREVVKGEYVLLLNSDTVVYKNTLKKCVEYLDKNSDVGVVTCKMVLPDGSLDKDARRSFPNPWISLTHLVLHLDKVFPKSKLFAKYWYGYKSTDETHDIDVAQGAFFMARKKALDAAGWFDEDYFLDGEDIDLSWKIKQDGWRIVYHPEVTITHVKKASKKKSSKKDRKRVVSAGMESMELFYKKRLWNEYPSVLNWIIILGIRLVKGYRVFKVVIN